MKSGRKDSGGRYKRPKKRKLSGRQGQARIVKLGETKTKVLKTKGVFRFCCASRKSRVP